jgi:hypothetical protein
MEHITASMAILILTIVMKELQTIVMKELQTIVMKKLQTIAEKYTEVDISTWHTRLIALLDDILPKEHHEEWLGDLREGYYQLIEDGTPLWKIYFITLLTGLGLIRSYLWLKADKFVSRWMTRAKKVFLG